MVSFSCAPAANRQISTHSWQANVSFAQKKSNPGVGPGPDTAPKILHESGFSRLLTTLLRIYTRHMDEKQREKAHFSRNSPRMRKQKLHNNRVRSTTPIFLPFLGPAAASSSALYSHRCGRFFWQKHGFPTIFSSRFSYKTR